METGLKVGDSVIYADSHRVERSALVTAVFSETCINVVYVSPNESEQDQYGRQLHRNTSVSRFNLDGNCFGNCFRAVDSEPVEYRSYPQQS